MINTESTCNFYTQVTNYGLFYLRFTLYYCIGEDRFLSKTDLFPIGGYRRIYYPVNAKHLKVSIEASIYIERWVKIFEENFPGRSNLCLSVYGLTFAPFVEKVCSEKSDFSYTIPLLSKLAYDKTYCNTSCTNPQSFCDNIECSCLENISDPIEVSPIPCNIKKQCCNCSNLNIPIDFDSVEYNVDIASIKEISPCPSQFLQQYFPTFNNTCQTCQPCSNLQQNIFNCHTNTSPLSNFDSSLCSLTRDGLAESDYNSFNINYPLENVCPSSRSLCMDDNINSSYDSQDFCPYLNNLDQQTYLYYTNLPKRNSFH